MQNHKTASTAIIIILVVLSTCAMFISLYKFDNKYTQKSTQPISGLFFVSDKILKETPVNYLVREWEVFPGKLLTPKDFDGATPDAYRKYIYIGQYSGMNMGNVNVSSHGSATYRMTFQLPSPARSYAIELPEIFSAYKLYLNDSLVAQLGDPSLEHYKEGIQNNIVHFTGEGRVQLVLAVSDYSGIYGGLTYPPGFGLADEVLKIRESWFAIHIAELILAAFGCFFSCYLAIASKRFQGLLFFICCFFYMLMIAFPIIHCIFLTDFQPLYTLEVSNYYVLLLLSVLIINNVFKVSRKANFISALPCAVTLTLFIIYGAGSHLWGMPIELFFSKLSDVIKAYTASYLLINSVCAFKKKTPFSLAFLCVSLVMAISLIFDRFYSLYEPIYGNWFNEIGYGILVLTVAGVLWIDLTSSYKERITLKFEKQQVAHLLDVQKDHYKQLSGQIQATLHATHDHRHHMRILNTWAEQNNIEEIKLYLNQYAISLAEREIVSLCNNPTVDAVAQYYKQLAEKQGIKYEARLILGDNTALQEDELCILLSNLLENAVEAASQSKNSPFIYISCEANQNGLFKLLVKNSFAGQSIENKDLHHSKKGAGHGIGLNSVKSIVEKYKGISDFQATDQVFTVAIIISGKCN